MWGIWKRPPDFTIRDNGTERMDRWYILPRNRWLNVYLHKLVQNDPTALHDHPWWNVSIVLKEGYWEDVPNDPFGPTEVGQWACEASKNYSAHLREMKATRYQPDKCHAIRRRAGSIVFRRAADAHRLRLSPLTQAPSWSLFITGPVRRKWGFWCKQGWVPFDQYVRKTGDGNDTGAGCG